MTRVELADVPASRQNVRLRKRKVYWMLGMHSLSKNLTWWGPSTLHTQMIDAGEWGMAWIPARVGL
jgi:hypothetical protein